MKPSTGFLTTNELVEAVKRRAYIPSAQNTLTDTDIINFLNEEMKDNLVPMLKASKEEYLIYPIYVPLEANKNKYEIPYRAVGEIIRDLKYQDTNNNLYPMTQIQLEDRHLFQDGSENRFMTFYFEGSNIVMWPGVGQNPSGGLKILFYMRPNDLVKEDQVGQIIDIDRTTGIITLDALPTVLQTASMVDLLQWKPGHRLIEYDVPVISVNTTNKQITLAVEDIPEELTVDDIIALPGQCIIPQLPPELQTLLVEKVVAQCMKAQGDLEGYSLSMTDLAKKEEKAAGLIKHRAEGNPQKIANFGSTLRRSKMNRFRF